MATRTLYSPTEAGRRCPDCGAQLEGKRQFCDRDRERRRALTFLYEAERHIDRIGGPAAAAAKDHVNGALGELAR